MVLATSFINMVNHLEMEMQNPCGSQKPKKGKVILMTKNYHSKSKL